MRFVVAAVVASLIASAAGAAGPVRRGAILYATDASPILNHSVIYVVRTDGSRSRSVYRSDGVRTQGTDRVAVSPAGDRVAFVDDQLYVVDLATGARRALGQSVYYSGPAWSPDGATLAFVRSEEGGPAIHTVLADGSGLRRRTRGYEPNWTPDGKRLIFVDHFQREGNPEIRSLELASGVEATLVRPRESLATLSSVSALSLSPDGERLAMAVALGGQNHATLTAAAAGGSVTKLSDSGGRPVWSPDSRLIAQAWVKALTITDPGRGSSRVLLRRERLDHPPSWSPRGDVVAVTANSSTIPSASHVYLVRADGGGMRTVVRPDGGVGSPAWLDSDRLVLPTHTWANDLDVVVDRGGPPVVLGGGPDRDCEPAVSPDGRTVAYVTSCDGSLPTIILRPVRGGRLRRLVVGTDPAWSPDGTAIAFAGHFDLGVHIVSARGRARPRMLVDVGFSPAWSPDGRELAVGRAGGGIVIVDVDGRRPPRVLRTGGGTEPDWSPDGRLIVFRSARSQLRVIRSDGTGQTRALTAFRAQVREPAWSPDGRTVLATVMPFTEGLDDTSIYAIPARLNRAARLADARRLTPTDSTEETPAWQPVCTIEGTPGPDVLRGTAGADVICGFGGDDTIRAGSGADVVLGGDGDDRIDGGPGSDRLFGAYGDDALLGRDGSVDVLDGGPGRDSAVADERDLRRP